MKKLFALLMISALLFSFGCAPNLTIQGEDSEAFAAYKAAYIQASEEYNKSLEKYLMTYDAMPPEVQNRWIETIDPLFEDAADFLNKWHRHVVTGTFIPSDMDEWQKVKDQLFLQLMQEKIKQQEEEQK